MARHHWWPSADEKPAKSWSLSVRVDRGNRLFSYHDALASVTWKGGEKWEWATGSASGIAYRLEAAKADAEQALREAGIEF